MVEQKFKFNLELLWQKYFATKGLLVKLVGYFSLNLVSLNAESLNKNQKGNRCHLYLWKVAIYSTGMSLLLSDNRNYLSPCSKVNT